MATANLPHGAGIIGAAVPRIDGPLKTTGTARYSLDHDFPGLVHAVAVQSTVGKGRIRSLDVSAAAKMPGILRILQPKRDISGHKRKFPAYYRLCMKPSPKATRAYEKFGYQVERHIGYVGHPYYGHVPVLRNIEYRLLRPLCQRAGVGMTSTAVLILRKPE